MQDIEFDTHDREALWATISTATKDACTTRGYNELTRAERAAFEKSISSKLTFTENEINDFFFKLENAASSVLFDLDMYKRRPTVGQSTELLNRVRSKSRDLSLILGNIDHASGKALKKKGYDALEIAALLERLSNDIEEDILSEIKRNKSLTKTIHPYRIMSANVIKAIDDLGLFAHFLTEQAKALLVEQVMRHSLELSSEENESEDADESDEPLAAYLRDYILEELKNFKTFKTL